MEVSGSHQSPEGWDGATNVSSYSDLGGSCRFVHFTHPSAPEDIEPEWNMRNRIRFLPEGILRYPSLSIVAKNDLPTRAPPALHWPSSVIIHPAETHRTRSDEALQAHCKPIECPNSSDNFGRRKRAANVHMHGSGPIEAPQKSLTDLRSPP